MPRYDTACCLRSVARLLLAALIALGTVVGCSMTNPFSACCLFAAGVVLMLTVCEPERI